MKFITIYLIAFFAIVISFFCSLVDFINNGILYSASSIHTICYEGGLLAFMGVVWIIYMCICNEK